MRYGATNLPNYSIQARDTLFTYAQLDAVPFTPKTNLVSRFTVIVNFLTPNDPLYRKVTSAVLASKEKAFVMYGSKLTRRFAFTTPPKASDKGNKDNTTPITPNDNVEAILLGLTSAITGSSSKTMTSTEREHASEAKENQAFLRSFSRALLKHQTTMKQQQKCSKGCPRQCLHPSIEVKQKQQSNQTPPNSN
jgi:hypothetical protein